MGRGVWLGPLGRCDGTGRMTRFCRRVPSTRFVLSDDGLYPRENTRLHPISHASLACKSVIWLILASCIQASNSHVTTASQEAKTMHTHTHCRPPRIPIHKVYMLHSPNSPSIHLQHKHHIAKRHLHSVYVSSPTRSSHRPIPMPLHPNNIHLHTPASPPQPHSK